MLQPAMSESDREGSPSIGAGAAVSHETASLAPLVRAVIASVLGESRTHPDVEDCTNEALRRAIEGCARLRDGEPLRPWVLGIARHVALDARRLRRRAKLHEAGIGGGDHEKDQTSPLDWLVDPTPGPFERAARHQQARRLDRALQGLGDAQRRAMLLFHVEGQGYQQIANQMGVPLGTVATWLARGRRTIADALGERGG
jgi:RNA polymerase sigma factor (sigma-70 family)